MYRLCPTPRPCSTSSSAHPAQAQKPNEVHRIQRPFSLNMSHASHRLAAEALERDAGATEMSPTLEHSSLFHEVHETLRRLLQHLIFASLLTLRLYMLPLLYISHKLAVQDDPWYLATWNMMLRPGRTMANCTCQEADSQPSIVERWNILRTSICAPLRILRTLYTLGQVIGEDPNVFQPPPPSILSAGPDSAIDMQSEQDDTLKLSGSAPTETTIDAPASASQIYHAALLNGTTLDDILAVFETPQSPGLDEHIFLDKGASPYTTHEERLTGPFIRRRYQNVSIHAISDRIQTPTKLLGNHAALSPRCNREVDTDRDHAQSQSPDESQSERITAHPGEVILVSGQSPIESDRGRDCFQQDVQEVTSPADIDRCPTFARRHRHSVIRKRSLSAHKPPLGLLQDRATVSSPVLAPTSPSKRARLQRRVKVFNDSDRACPDQTKIA